MKLRRLSLQWAAYSSVVGRWEGSPRLDSSSKAIRTNQMALHLKHALQLTLNSQPVNKPYCTTNSGQTVYTFSSSKWVRCCEIFEKFDRAKVWWLQLRISKLAALKFEFDLIEKFDQIRKHFYKKLRWQRATIRILQLNQGKIDK